MSDSQVEAMVLWDERSRVKMDTERSKTFRRAIEEYKFALRAEIDARIATIPAELLAKYDEQALGFHGALTWCLETMNTVKPKF